MNGSLFVAIMIALLTVYGILYCRHIDSGKRK